MQGIMQVRISFHVLRWYDGPPESVTDNGQLFVEWPEKILDFFVISLLQNCHHVVHSVQYVQNGLFISAQVVFELGSFQYQSLGELPGFLQAVVGFQAQIFHFLQVFLLDKVKPVQNVDKLAIIRATDSPFVMHLNWHKIS